VSNSNRTSDHVVIPMHKQAFKTDGAIPNLIGT